MGTDIKTKDLSTSVSLLFEWLVNTRRTPFSQWKDETIEGTDGRPVSWFVTEWSEVRPRKSRKNGGDVGYDVVGKTGRV